MALREIVITAFDCVKGKMFHYKLRYIRYAAFCCLDGCLVLGFTIWTTVMLAVDENEGGPFVNMSWANVIIGYCYFCLTCCAPGPCLQVYHAGNADRYIT